MEILKISYNELIESSKCSEKIFYEISGKKMLFKFKDFRYFLFSGKNFNEIILSKKFLPYKQAISATLTCIPIETLNPQDIWFKIIVNEDFNLIQIIQSGTNLKNFTTEKLLKNYLEKFDIVEYGDIKIFNRAGYFFGHDQLEKILVAKDPEEEFSFNEKDIELFESIKEIYFSHGYKPLEGISKKLIRKVRVSTFSGDFSIFRAF